jgi:RecA-family ATPase
MGAGDLKREAPAATREWLWTGYIPRGSVSILAAYPKVGKSTFLYPLVVAISRGEPFLGLSTTKTPVLILSEEPQDVIQERLESLGCIENDPFFKVHALPTIIDLYALADIDAWMRDTHGLLLIDTIAEYCGIQDESDNAEIMKRLAPLKRSAREHKATVLYVHHDRKNDENAAQGKAIRGGSAYLGIVDLAFTMDRTGGTGSRRRVLKSMGRYRDIPGETEVEWDGEVGFTLVRVEGGMTGAQHKLWEALTT